MQDVECDGVKAEGRRDRVRRLLLNRLIEDGFRRPRELAEDEFKQRLGRLADVLGYMTDGSLEVLYQMMRSKGQGRARDIWPPRATFYAFAEIIEPCPLAEVPSLASWFGSNQGPLALRNDCLVETLEYIVTRKRPPVEDGAKRQIAHQAKERARAIDLARSRMASGHPHADDAAFLSWYEARRTEALSFLPDPEAAR